MNIFNIWWVNVIFYLIFAVIFTQFFKVATKTSKKDGALIVGLEFLAGIFILLVSPFFEFKFPTDWKAYLFLGLSIIFYAIADRLSTTVRRGIEASSYNILQQISTVFMIIVGLVFFKEPFVWNKILGAILIIFSNIFIFYKKGKFKVDKYIILGIIGQLSFSIAMFLDVNISDNFNLPMYISITLMVPALLIFLFERPKLKEIRSEFTDGNFKALLITAISWGLMIVSQLRAYQFGNITIVSPLCAITVILNVISGYVFLKERDNLLNKIIAGILIIISVILIRL